MKTILITGGTSGLGYELAKLYLEKNHQVIILGRSKSKLDYALHHLKPYGEVQGYPLDISDNNAVMHLASQLPDLDLLINCAGIGYFGSFLELNKREIVEMIDINLKGTILVTHAFLPKVKEQVMNIISTAGLKGKVNESVYVATKFGVRGFTEALQKELPLQVTAVYMGGMDTPFWHQSNHIKEPSKLKSPKDVAMEIFEKNDGRSEIIIEK
ncbi:MAG: SDR family NAD(P)-dependent oxidoreductase [Clostridia bacterium]|nr:SDR family NAD(P)-dependent oxidoreductase [Clostridia bacterium]